MKRYHRKAFGHRLCDRRKHYESRSKLERFGSITGLLDRDGNYLRVGDYVSIDETWRNSGILLYDAQAKQYGAFRGQWYGDDPYNNRSYGKVTWINSDNGMRMQMRKISREEFDALFDI